MSMINSVGMVRVGRIELPDDHTFSITLEMVEAAIWERAIYAFVIGGEVKRIGSSKGKLGAHFKSWNRDVAATLCGQPESTPPSEAEAWPSFLSLAGLEHGRTIPLGDIGLCPAPVRWATITFTSDLTSSKMS
jgi:hypothetical protein